MSVRYKPNVTVACIIHSQGKYLLVEENIDGEIRYNQPAGHLEASESIEDACLREVSEETGLNISIGGLVGIYQYQATPNLAFLRFTFCAGLPQTMQGTPNDPQIIATNWYSYQEIVSMREQLRSPLVLQSINDYQSGNIHELSLFNADYLIAQSSNA